MSDFLREKPEEYWSIIAFLSKHGQKERFEANLITRLKDMAAFNSEESALFPRRFGLINLKRDYAGAERNRFRKRRGGKRAEHRHFV